jgi:hypothetical protein
MNQISSTSIRSLESAQGTFKQSPLSSEQLQLVADTLKKYDPNSLSNDDKKAINTAFLEAGIRPSASLKVAITSAGFKAEVLKPSDSTQVQHGNRPPPPKTSDTSTETSDSSVDLTLLQSLKDLLTNVNLSNSSASELNDLISNLDELGVNSSGNLINTTA